MIRYNLTNQKFGRLLVLRQSVERKAGKVIWICQCDCGNTSQLTTYSLKTRGTISCGCYNRELLKTISYKGGKYIGLSEFNSIRDGAIERNLEFNITIEDIEAIYENQNKKCALSNIDITFNSRKENYKRTIGNASVDRIDNSLGYNKENVQILDTNVNYAKRIMSQEDFINLCNNVTKTHPRN